jgi:hypothetical protein
MAKHDLTTKGRSPTDLIEVQSRHMLRSKIPLQEAIIEDYGDKYPNLDGHIEFLSNIGSTTVKLFFQLKATTREDAITYDCEKDFLNYCYQAHEPTALIFVNIPQDRVYWRLINRAYIVSTLGIKDLEQFDQQTKRVTFSDDQLIDDNAAQLFEACEKHYADTAQSERYAQETRARGQLASGQEAAIKVLEQALSSEQKVIGSEAQQAKELAKEPAKKTFFDLEKHFAERLSDLPDKMMLYHAFVHALRPFYLDRRSQQKRIKLLEFLKITDAEERFIIESLARGDLIGRAGDLIFVTNKPDALLSLDHYLDTGAVDPEQVAQVFSDEEDQ